MGYITLFNCSSVN